jgi:ABC-type Fe3+ transport system permease subunit
VVGSRAHARALSEGTLVSRFRTPVHLVLQSTNALPFALPPFIWLYALPTLFTYLVSDAGRTRFAAKEAFIIYTQGSCKAKLGGSRSELCTRVSFLLGS